MDPDVVRADIAYRLTLTELWEAHRAARRAVWPKRSLAADVFAGLLSALFLFAGSFVAIDAASGRDGAFSFAGLSTFAFAIGCAFAFSTPGRSLLIASLGLLAVRRESRDVILESFSASSARFRTKDASSDVAHRGFPVHVETRRLFVIATAAAVPVCAVPKRALGDAATLAAFRALVMREGGEAIAEAMHAFVDPGDEGSVEYVPDVDELFRAAWLLLLYTSPRVTQGIVFVGVLVAPAWAVSQLDLELLVPWALLVGGALWYGVRRARARARAQIRPVRFVVDDAGLRAHSENGVLGVTWTQALGYVEKDPRLMIVVIRPGFGLVLPTRALPAEWLDEVRARLAPYRRA